MNDEMLIAALRAPVCDSDEAASRIESLLSILQRTSIELLGPESTHHDWHRLPDVAASLRKQAGLAWVEGMKRKCTPAVTNTHQLSQDSHQLTADSH